MSKVKSVIEYTDLEDFEIAQSVNEFGDFAGYEQGDKIPLSSLIESDDVEDFVKDYFIDYCQTNNSDAEDTVINYSW